MLLSPTKWKSAKGLAAWDVIAGGDGVYLMKITLSASLVCFCL